jgi:hypothetical protein
MSGHCESTGIMMVSGRVNCDLLSRTADLYRPDIPSVPNLEGRFLMPGLNSVNHLDRLQCLPRNQKVKSEVQESFLSFQTARYWLAIT